jgi:hypothetical protein
VRPSAEARLILLACREGRPTTERLQRSVAAVVRWDRFTDACRRHRVAGLVLAAAEQWLPIAVAARLRDLHVREVARQTRLRAALREMLDALHASDCRVLPFKGSLLAEELYPLPALRPYADLDLLAVEADYERAARLLLALGYRSREEPALPPRSYAEQSHRERLFVSADGLVPVELHVDPLLVGLRPRSSEAWWARSVAGSLVGSATRLLAPEHRLLIAGVHLQRHALGLLSWLKDLDLLVRRGIDWDRFLDAARREEVEGLLWYPLFCARRLLDAPVPERALDSLAPARPLCWLLRASLPVAHLVDRKVTPARRRAVDPLGALLMGRRGERLRHLFRDSRWAGRGPRARPVAGPRSGPGTVAPGVRPGT